MWSLFELRAASAPDTAAVVVDGGATLTYGELQVRVARRASEIARVARPADVIAVDDLDPHEFVTTYLAATSLDGCGVDLGPLGGAATVRAAGDAAVRVDPDGFTAPTWDPDGCVVIYTSGSTGTPKATVHGPNSITGGIWNTCAVADEALHPGRPSHPGTGEEVITDLARRTSMGLVMCVGLPARSVGGLSVINRALALGDTVVFPAELTARAIAAAATNHPVTNLGVAPFSAQQIGRLHSAGEIEGPAGLLACGIGSAAARREVCETLEAWAQAPVTVAYGTTELGGVALMPRPWEGPEVRWETVGCTLPGIDVRFTAGGLLEVRSAAAMLGVLDRSRFLHPTGEWVETGDVAVMTDDGHVVIEGRSDYVISRGGRRVDPVRIEQALEAHPGVRRAGVLGVPSRVAGEHDVIALVELDPAVSAAEVREACVRRLPPHEVPRKVIVVGQLPTSRDGKPVRAHLPALVE